MYNFQPRLPLDHALAIGKIFRDGELVPKRSEVLILSGCVLGEVGALLASTNTTLAELPKCNYTMEECFKVLEPTEPSVQGLTLLELIPILLQIIALLKENL